MPPATRILLGALAYCVVSFAVAAPWHLVLFAKTYDQVGAMTRAEPLVAFGLISMLIQGFVVAYLYPVWYRPGVPVLQGMKFGLIAGALVHSVFVFSKPGEIDINPVTTYLAVALPFYLLHAGLTGAAVGLVYGRREK